MGVGLPFGAVAILHEDLLIALLTQPIPIYT